MISSIYGFHDAMRKFVACSKYDFSIFVDKTIVGLQYAVYMLLHDKFDFWRFGMQEMLELRLARDFVSHVRSHAYIRFYNDGIADFLNELLCLRTIEFRYGTYGVDTAF